MTDLECNPMYLALQSKYRKQYEGAHLVTGCCFLIPNNDSLKNVEISEEIINLHVVKPSPYFKGEFVNLYGNDTKTVQIEDAVVKRLTGFPDGNSPIKILEEEIGYNKHNKPFYIYVIDQPMINLNKKNCLKENENLRELNIPASWLEGSSTATLTECKMILQSLGDGEALRNLEDKLGVVLKNYLFLPDYLEEASHKLQSIVEKSVKDIQMQGALGSQTSSVLHTVVESFIMIGLHNHLFPIICQRFASEDQALTNKLMELNASEITAAQLGAMEIFSCPIPATVVELARLDSLMCPKQKVQCLKNTIDLVAAEVKQHLLETRGLLTPPGGLPFLTTDDLIPVLLTAIIRARLFHLATDVYYLEHFLWCISSKDVYSYSFVTFKAAVEFLKNADTSRLGSTENKLKKELSLEELMEVTEKMDSKTSVVDDEDEFGQLTAVDRQMERIAKMIEESTRELSSVQHHGVQTSSKYS